MKSYQERLMRGGALRHVVASLPPEAARALAAVAASARSEEDMRELLAELRKEGMFNAERAESMPDAEAVALASFRYHLGRMTAAVHVCVERLEHEWHGFGEATQATILAEIRAALDGGAAGMRVDATAWRGLLEKFDEAAAPSASPGRRP